MLLIQGFGNKSGQEGINFRRNIFTMVTMRNLPLIWTLVVVFVDFGNLADYHVGMHVQLSFTKNLTHRTSSATIIHLQLTMMEWIRCY